jgi:Sigma-70, region 4
VLRKRFGIDDGIDRTLEQVAAEWDLTRERIRQIEAKALERLAKESFAPELRELTDIVLTDESIESIESTDSIEATGSAEATAAPSKPAGTRGRKPGSHAARHRGKPNYVHTSGSRSAKG